MFFLLTSQHLRVNAFKWARFCMVNPGKPWPEIYPDKSKSGKSWDKSAINGALFELYVFVFLYWKPDLDIMDALHLWFLSLSLSQNSQGC